MDDPITFAYGDEFSEPLLTLYRGPLGVSRNGRTELLEGSIGLSFEPFQSFTVELSGHPGDLLAPDSFPQEISIEIPTGEGHGEANIWSSTIDRSRPGLLTHCGHLKGPFLKGRSSAIEVLRFCVPNFTEQVRGRLSIMGGDYDIAIEEVSQFSAVLSGLASEGGFAITHLGRVRRSDSGLMSLEEARHITETLTWWLSILRGERTGPILVSGVLSDVVAWELWASPGVHSWTGPKSWLPDHLDDSSVAASLGEMFNHLHALPAGEVLSESVHRLIDWYTQSQHEDHTGAIIITAQAGLELASWLSLVVDAGKTKFHEPNAAKRLRAALQGARISPEIPTSLPLLREDSEDLLRSAERKNAGAPLDGPKVITEFRNSMVHPRSEGRLASPELQLQCLQLAIRFLELLILHRLGYVGMTKDKADSAWPEVLVPWAY